MNKINYSIIIPHKNIPELLQRCLDSIPKRDDIQIIVVDDNSDPDKINFEAFPGLHDSCVEVIFTKEGKGAGYARNIGLSKATGNWLLFADADDFFNDNFLDILEKYKESCYDLINFGALCVDSYTGLENEKGIQYTVTLNNAIKENNLDRYKYTANAAMAPWAKMIKHALIIENNIFFDETMVANDRFFSVKTFFYSNNTCFNEQKIYIRELRGGSLITLRTKEAQYTRFSVFIRINAFFDNNNLSCYKKELIPLVKRQFNIHDMSWFFKYIKLFKENNYCFFYELIKFIINRKIKPIFL